MSLKLRLTQMLGGGKAPAIIVPKFRFNAKDYEKLKGVQWQLVHVMEVSITRSPVQFRIVDGVRARAQQAKYVASGASTTMNSRHLTGAAVDIAPEIDGKLRWDWPLYHQIAPVIKQTALDLGIAIVWGGDWKTFPDGPHFELDRRVYP